MITYITIAIILLAVFSYFATKIDDHYMIYDLTSTFGVGVIACAIWPISIVALVLSAFLYYIMKLGAKHRGEY
jgi:amino acid transporter